MSATVIENNAYSDFTRFYQSCVIAITTSVCKRLYSEGDHETWYSESNREMWYSEGNHEKAISPPIKQAIASLNKHSDKMFARLDQHATVKLDLDLEYFTALDFKQQIETTNCQFDEIFDNPNFYLDSPPQSLVGMPEALHNQVKSRTKDNKRLLPTTERNLILTELNAPSIKNHFELNFKVELREALQAPIQEQMELVRKGISMDEDQMGSEHRLNVRAFNKLQENKNSEEHKKYQDNFVAFFNGKVIDQDPDQDALLDRTDENEYIFVGYIGEGEYLTEEDLDFTFPGLE